MGSECDKNHKFFLGPEKKFIYLTKNIIYELVKNGDVLTEDEPNNKFNFLKVGNVNELIMIETCAILFLL